MPASRPETAMQSATLGTSSEVFFSVSPGQYGVPTLPCVRRGGGVTAAGCPARVCWPELLSEEPAKKALLTKAGAGSNKPGGVAMVIGRVASSDSENLSSASSLPTGWCTGVPAGIRPARASTGALGCKPGRRSEAAGDPGGPRTRCRRPPNAAAAGDTCLKRPGLTL
eukprot:CAMPEP_0179084570 /NCGR_PEP_ID=MMETSP0796-20121207/38253_1 /TAXON_ID=73915 /ORGANISM="Pyrodinium bahamense, Strain pbaha01" /LENGTH=167 /DNA_ID=CAMNT_0020781995 /DNA_START=492 /DNA_END=992 /DNA_ORIENTATION=+